MTTSISAEERAIRARLDEAVQRIRSSLRRCPAVEDLDLVEVEHAALVADEANQALLEALECTEALENLRAVSEESIVLVATARTGLQVVREVLTILTAAIDARSDAA